LPVNWLRVSLYSRETGKDAQRTRAEAARPMSADPDKLAIETEADRLSGIYLRVRMLAKAQRTDVLEAGREAVAMGLISERDWELVRAAIAER
jgi:hypothetical protein